MPKTYADLMVEVRNSTTAVGLDELHRRIEQDAELTLVDVREKEEFRKGFIRGAVNIPRGFLELQIEKRVPDKSTPIVVYCAAGVRSALAAKSLAELGYTAVETLNPGFVRWKDGGYAYELPPELSDAQRDRYARHIMLDEVGEVGQAKLLASKVLLLGAGGLGSPAALYLAAAGVGTLGIVDPDVVDASNLQRQVLHATSRLGQAKVDSAALALGDLNPDVNVVKIEERVDSSNVERIFKGFDIVVDGCDNFPTRYLVNDASVWMNIPVAHGSIFRFEGQVTTFLPNDGPCYRCLYPEPPPPHLAPSCAEAGVLGILPGLVGVLQATEAIKYLLGRGDLLKGRLICYDSLRMHFRQLKMQRDPNCPVCGPSPTITSYVDYDQFCNG